MHRCRSDDSKESPEAPPWLPYRSTAQIESNESIESIDPSIDFDPRESLWLRCYCTAVFIIICERSYDLYT